MNLPYITLSCAMSIDGYLDSAVPCRLTFSNDEDFDRVDQLRADSDAIMVGASTVRRDNPRLLVRSDARRRLRVAAGRSWSPTKVTVTATGDLPAESSFFAVGDVEKLVYCPGGAVGRIADRLRGMATVVGLGDEVTMRDVAADLAGRGMRRLMVEGGGRLHTQFLVEDLVDELQLVVAPFFVGESRAPRFVEAGRFPWTATRRARLAETRRIGDVVLLRYALSDRFPDAVALEARDRPQQRSDVEAVDHSGSRS
jgi:5-amino-6-(5-phosphoribosylamino)uracil reductase